MPDLRVPDACSLTRPQLEDRLRWIRQEILPHARGREKLDGGVAWRFDPDPALRARLEQLVALESDCCDPDEIRFSLHEEPQGLRLEVRGLDPETTLLGA